MDSSSDEETSMRMRSSMVLGRLFCAAGGLDLALSRCRTAKIVAMTPVSPTAAAATTTVAVGIGS